MHTVARVALTFVLAQTVASAAAWACSCAPDTLSVDEKLSLYDIVFVGTVKRQRAGCDTTPFSSSSTDPVYYTLEVTQAFQGVSLGEEVSIQSATSGASCGVELGDGESWLIYTNNGRYGLCDPGGRADEVASEIEDLQEVSG